jgi:hypothetical protein
MDSSFGYVFCAISTMYTIQQKAHTMLWYTNFESVIQVQSEFQCECGVSQIVHSDSLGRSEEEVLLHRWLSSRMVPRHCTDV